MSQEGVSIFGLSSKIVEGFKDQVLRIHWRFKVLAKNTLQKDPSLFCLQMMVLNDSPKVET